MLKYFVEREQQACFPVYGSRGLPLSHELFFIGKRGSTVRLRGWGSPHPPLPANPQKLGKLVFGEPRPANPHRSHSSRRGTPARSPFPNRGRLTAIQPFERWDRGSPHPPLTWSPFPNRGRLTAIQPFERRDRRSPHSPLKRSPFPNRGRLAAIQPFERRDRHSPHPSLTRSPLSYRRR